MEAKIHPWFDPGMLVGTTLQGYKLVEFLGAGGFGAVYRTANPQGQPWAIKVLYPPHSLSGEDVRVWNARAMHFLQEANTATRFNHPNIIKVYGVGQVNWHYNDPLQGRQGYLDRSADYTLDFYVAEYIPDGVDRRLKEGRLFTPDEAVPIGIQVCNALKVLHSATPQVLHRDLNPGNIRLAEGGGAVVTDFGVARTEGLPGAYITTEGPLVHRGVSAPEQFAGEEPDVRTDIFQFGALLLVMLTGKFPRQPDLQMLPPAEMQTLLDQRGVPEELTETILRCLEKARVNRFQDVDSLEIALLPRGVSGPTDLARPSGPRAATLSRICWQLRLPSPNWRTLSTPIVESQGACYVWDSHTVYRLDPTTGAPLWTWKTPALKGKPATSIQDSPENPPVQVLGGRLYVRHGNFLFCLDAADHSTKWQYEHWSDITGLFLAVEELIILDCYNDAGRVSLGPAAMNAETSETIWHLRDSDYHVSHMAATEEMVILVESRGVAASGGLRVRLVDLSNGAVLGIHQVVGLHGEGRENLGEYSASKAPAISLHRPIVTPDGSIVIWLSDLVSTHPYVLCFDPDLTLRWGKLLKIGGTRSEHDKRGRTHITGAGQQLLATRVGYNDAGGSDQGWMANLGLHSGELQWERPCPDNAIPTNAMAAPESSVTFVVASQGHRPKTGVNRWRLTAIDAQTGGELWKGPERESPRDSIPLTPVVTSSHVYLQLPLKREKNQGHPTRVEGRGIVEAFKRL